jgi:hypothetical protein
VKEVFGVDFSFCQGSGARSPDGYEFEEWLVSEISSLHARHWWFQAGEALARLPSIRELQIPGLLLSRRVARNSYHFAFCPCGVSFFSS